MRVSILSFVLIGVPLLACGKIESDPDAAPSGIDSAVDAVAGDDALPVDAPIDGATDGPPADAARFQSGSYGWENLASGNPTTPLDISGGAGAMFSKPAPNPGGSQGIFLVDCNMNSGAFGFGCSASSQHVPEGRKFIVYADFNAVRPLEFTFPSDIGAFSVALSCTDGSAGTFTLVGIDANDIDVTSANVTVGAIANWRATRVGVQRATGFRKVQIRRNTMCTGVIAVDALQWSST